MQDYRGSIVDCTKALEIFPEFAEAYFTRGAAKLKVDQKDSGCLDLSRAGELGYKQAYEVIQKFCQ